ncbi:MAG: ferritin family protein [Anaerolineae bacterium]|nr:ferritin family protein [Anaerolineae bacterium]MDW8102203.1 ferritin family protein [Anaerolineae bacterium]
MLGETLSILALAVKNEKMGKDFYSEASRRSLDDRGRRTFAYLAQMEEEHLRILLAEYEAIRQGKSWLSRQEALEEGKKLDISQLPEPEEAPEGFFLPPFIFPPPEEAPGLKGDVAALEYALKLEERSYALYKEARDKTSAPAGKEVYSLLMEEENRHYKVLREALEYLVANQTWWDDWEKPFFEG